MKAGFHDGLSLDFRHTRQRGAFEYFERAGISPGTIGSAKDCGGETGTGHLATCRQAANKKTGNRINATRLYDPSENFCKNFQAR